MGREEDDFDEVVETFGGGEAGTGACQRMVGVPPGSVSLNGGPLWLWLLLWTALLVPPVDGNEPPIGVVSCCCLLIYLLLAHQNISFIWVNPKASPFAFWVGLTKQVLFDVHVPKLTLILLDMPYRDPLDEFVRFSEETT